jgi:hypothetical protein
MWNFFKGQVGLWFRLCLVVGVAVATSTYLSGVISFLATATLYLGGIFRDFIKDVAEGVSGIGGPLEAMYRITQRDFSAPIEPETAPQRMVLMSDELFRWLWRRVLNVVPDVDRFDLSMNVAEGFNINGGQLLMTGLLLVGYLLIPAVLAYYLMKWREIAASM